MATIEIKFAIGDTVYRAGSSYENKTMQCPDCMGTGQWTVRFADGKEVPCPCQTCERGWQGSPGYLTYNEHEPIVKQLTIGQVGFEEGRGRYMCIETGIGSGSIHYEEFLFKTEEEAKIQADVLYEERMKYIAKNNFSKRDSFARKLGTFGYCRADALEKERQMRQWCGLLDRRKTKDKKE